MNEVEAKWEVYDRCNRDKSTAQGMWDMLHTRCKMENWGQEWTPSQINEFRKFLNLLLPNRTEWSKIKETVAEVFGDIREINYYDWK